MAQRAEQVFGPREPVPELRLVTAAGYPPGFTQAFRILRVAFTVAPIVTGVDKFFHALANWDQYLAPVVPRILGIPGHTFMQIAGVVEIIAGIGIALLPRVFGYIVGLWLLGIVANLLLSGNYYDIALRDLGLALGAFALARLADGFKGFTSPRASLS